MNAVTGMVHSSGTEKTDVSFVNYFTTYFVYHIEDSSISKMVHPQLLKKGGVEKTRRYI